MAYTLTVRDQCGRTVKFALIPGLAAAQLAAQLPLRAEADRFGCCETLFYPPHALCAEDLPPAAGGAGTLAYYAPWGAVVLFSGPVRLCGALYALGRAQSGAQEIAALCGMLTVTIEEGESL